MAVHALSLTDLLENYNLIGKTYVNSEKPLIFSLQKFYYVISGLRTPR